jgi:hypothetical protein
MSGFLFQKPFLFSLSSKLAGITLLSKFESMSLGPSMSAEEVDAVMSEQIELTSATQKAEQAELFDLYKDSFSSSDWALLHPKLPSEDEFCCDTHRSSVWNWAGKDSAEPLHRFVFGNGHCFIAPSSLRHLIPNPKSPTMIGMKNRLATFWGVWPKQMAQNPEDMAKAGFFFNQTGDSCTTFCCGLRLKQWNHWEDPIKEHKKHSPACFLPNILGK